MSNVGTLRQIPQIVELFEIGLSSQILKATHPKRRAKAQHNSRHIFAYRITYASSGHRVIGFIVEPRGRSRLPCIIWNRGGSREFGKIKHHHLFTGLADLATLGYIVTASQYSGSGGSEGVDQMGGEDIHDVLNLYNILRAYKRADRQRIGMYGWSRGRNDDLSGITQGEVD